MDESPSTPAAQSAARSQLLWLIVCLIATTAISLAAAHTPPRVRLIGLFSVAFGLVVGWIVLCLAALLEYRPAVSFAATVAGLMSCLGLIGSTWETWRLEVSRDGDMAKERITERLVEHLKSAPAPTAGAKLPIDDSAVSGFRWYLSRRIRQLGRWPSPWPELFWCLELTASTIAAALISIKCHNAFVKLSTTSSPDQSL